MDIFAATLFWPVSSASAHQAITVDGIKRRPSGTMAWPGGLQKMFLTTATRIYYT